MSLHKTLTALSIGLALSGAQASLVDQNNGTVLDTQAGLVWLKDWAAIGSASWTTQKNWVDNLTFAGSGGWALPTLSQYASLWAAAGSTPEGIAASFVVPAPELFLYYGPLYWTSEIVPDGVLTAMTFWMDAGTSGGPSWAYHQLHATAVRVASDAELNPVPIPAAAWLMLSGIGAMGAFAKKRRALKVTA